MNHLNDLKNRQAQARAETAYQHTRQPAQPNAGHPHRPTDNPLRRRCPWCKATPSQPCTIPGTAIRLGRHSRYHPSRTETPAAQQPAAQQPAAHANP